MDRDIFEEALNFAMEAHHGVTRKSASIPFLLHPMEAAVIVSTMTEDPEVIAAALLHDTVEDAGVSFIELQARFGERVAELVASETEDKHWEILPEDSWTMRKEESLKALRASTDRDVKIVWLADKLSNLRSFYRLYLKKKESMWEDFHQRDPWKQQWYYTEVLKNVQELKDEAAYSEYSELLVKLFGGQEDGTD